MGFLEGFKVRFWWMNLGSSEFEVRPVKFKVGYNWVRSNTIYRLSFPLLPYGFPDIVFLRTFKNELYSLGMEVLKLHVSLKLGLKYSILLP